MYSPKAIEQACGTNALRYARRKASGGASGQKGTRYEDLFAIFKIGETAASAFVTGQGNFRPEADTTVYSQLVCFIDDLVLRQGRKRFVLHYQAKNRQSTSWGTGPRSLKSDFTRQLELCASVKLKCSLNLVVSDPEKARALSDTIPPVLRTSTKAIYFPYENIAELLRTEPLFRNVFAALSPRSAPTDSDLLSTATLLLGTWADTGNRVTVRELLIETNARGIRGGGPVLRPLKPRKRVSPSLKSVLDAIPGFHYAVEKGFMQWRYGSTDSGCYRYPCHSKEFEAFVKRQIQRQPKRYDDIEGELT